MIVPAMPSRAECDALTHRIFELASNSVGEVEFYSTVRASLGFARGAIHVADEAVRSMATLRIQVGGRWGEAATNQFDEGGLRTMTAEAERLARENPTIDQDLSWRPAQVLPDGPQIYFDTTAAAATPEQQAALARHALQATAAANLVAAGNIVVESRTRALRTTEGFFGWERSNYGELSLTVRDPARQASGWAWSGYEDWSRVDPAATVARALGVAQRSANPVAVEPGRYTVILEPAAVAALIEPILLWWPAGLADAGITVFAKDPLGTNKIGLQMMDRRLGMVADPRDPERPGSMVDYDWLPVGRVNWFERGVLKHLEYRPEYARRRGRAVVLDPGGVRLTAEGPATSLEEMIASVKRGIWITRFSHVTPMNVRTALLTGTTRDGTFLIENGKVTRSVKNLRFTDGPFFAFNRLEAWGEPVRASRNVIAPRLLLRDLAFTSLTDSI